VGYYLKNIWEMTDKVDGKPFAAFPGSMVHYHDVQALRR
jgi:hypothetical protein